MSTKTEIETSRNEGTRQVIVAKKASAAAIRDSLGVKPTHEAVARKVARAALHYGS